MNGSVAAWGRGDWLQPSLWEGRDADEPIKKEKETESFVVYCVQISSIILSCLIVHYFQFTNCYVFFLKKNNKRDSCIFYVV